MSIQDRYQAYADAFEESYLDDDWARIEPFFTEGAVYEGDPEANGRDALIAKLKNGVDAFDRRMDSRTPDFNTPTMNGDVLTMKWQVTYTKAGAPDMSSRASRPPPSRAIASHDCATTSIRPRQRPWASG